MLKLLDKTPIYSPSLDEFSLLTQHIQLPKNTLALYVSTVLQFHLYLTNRLFCSAHILCKRACEASRMLKGNESITFRPVRLPTCV